MAKNYRPPKPHFAWEISLPADWASLELSPTQVASSTEQLLNDYLPGLTPGTHLYETYKDMFIASSETARKSKAYLFLMLPLLDQEVEITWVSLMLRWRYTPPTSPPYDVLERSYKRKEAFETRTTLKSQRYALITEEKQGLIHHHAILPLPQTAWTLVVTGSAMLADLSEEIRALVKRVTNSFHYELTAADTAEEENYCV